MSSAGRCIACSTSSGIVVGPGIARNSRPARTTMVAVPCWWTAMLAWPGAKSKRIGGMRGIGRGRLSSGLAAAGGFGLVDRTEPARALADLHLDLGVPAAGAGVIDALAGAVDVALDGAVG